MAYQCDCCGRQIEGGVTPERGFAGSKCPSSYDGYHHWTYYKSAADYAREDNERRRREERQANVAANKRYEGTSSNSNSGSKSSKGWSIFLVLLILALIGKCTGA